MLNLKRLAAIGLSGAVPMSTMAFVASRVLPSQVTVDPESIEPFGTFVVHGELVRVAHAKVLQIRRAPAMWKSTRTCWLLSSKSFQIAAHPTLTYSEMRDAFEELYEEKKGDT